MESTSKSKLRPSGTDLSLPVLPIEVAEVYNLNGSTSEQLELLRTENSLLKHTIKELKKENLFLKKQNTSLECVREHISKLEEKVAHERALDRQRLAKLETRPKLISQETQNAHSNRLHEQMNRFHLRQVTVRESASLIGVSKDHMKKIKRHLADDPRFVIVKDPHHKQRHLIRLI